VSQIVVICALAAPNVGLGTIRSARTLFLIRNIKRNVSVVQHANAPTPIRDPFPEPPGRDPPAQPVTRARSWPNKLIPFAFVRFLIAFFIGVVATLAWQSYGRAARETIARWLAPGPIAQAEPTASSDDLLAISRSLTALRDGLDKLATDITKLQATKHGTADETSAHLASPVEVQVHRPLPPTPWRAAPGR
jgi:hypothetical protein